MFIVRFFQSGGFFMFPILFVLLVGLAIAIERWIHLKKVQTENDKAWDQLYPVLEKGEFDKARDMANLEKLIEAHWGEEFYVDEGRGPDGPAPPEGGENDNSH